MGTVYRKTFTKPLPSGAEIFSEDGKRFARWTDGRGKLRSEPVTTGRDGSDRLLLQAATYTAKFRNGERVVQEIATGCRTKDAARAVLKERIDRAERVRAKILSPGEDRVADHQETPLADHFAEYIDHQRAKGVNRARISNTESRLRRIAADCKLRRLADLNCSALERWLLDRQQENMSAGARNGYREAWIGFGNWCVRTDRLMNNPLSALPKADAKADQRRARRALTEDELLRLLDATQRRPLLDAMTVRYGPDAGQLTRLVTEEQRQECLRVGWERALIYKTFVLTGLRKAELASLTVGQLELDAQPPFAVLAAADDKSRRGADIPLRADLAAELRAWLTDQQQRMQTAESDASATPLPRDLPVFHVSSQLRAILDRDLKLAGIPKRDDRGRTVDVHALRHTFGTHLSKGGVAPRTAQAAMRHSSIDLTMNVYTDPRLLDVHGALDALPVLALKGIESPTPNSHPSAAADAPSECKCAPSLLAPMLAPNLRKGGPLLSIVDPMGGRGERHEQPTPRVVTPDTVNGKGSLSTGDNDPQQSGRLDLNQRPLRPERSALPG